MADTQRGAGWDETEKMGEVGRWDRDDGGHAAAATSNGGKTEKVPGRVGDRPLVGAGCYANNASVAVSGTGTGELFTSTPAAYDSPPLTQSGRPNLCHA